MKYFVSVVILLVVAGLIPSFAMAEHELYTQDEDTDLDGTALLFIVDGQSNANTFGDGGRVDNQLLVSNNQTLIRSPQFRSHLPNPNDWVVLNPFHYPSNRFMTLNIDGEKPSFGVELSFGRLMKQAYPEKVIAIAKRNRGGTSIIAWDKNHTEPEWRENMRRVDHNPGVEPQYPELIQLVRESKRKLLDIPEVDRVKIGGIIWIQGERDSNSTFGAENYESNLINLIENLRTDLQIWNLPFMFIEAHMGKADSQRIVDRAVRSVDRDVAQAGLVLVDDLPTYSDNAHFSTAGLIELGGRFFEEYQQLAPRPTATPIHTPSPRITGPTQVVTSTIAPVEWDLNGDGGIDVLDYAWFVRGFMSEFGFDKIMALVGEM